MTTFVKTQFFDKFGSIVLLKVVAKLENNTQNRSVRMKIQCSLGSCACKWFTDTVQNPSILKALGTRNLQVGMGILTFLVIAFFFKCYFSQIKWYWVTDQFDMYSWIRHIRFWRIQYFTIYDTKPLVLPVFLSPNPKYILLQHIRFR